MDHLYPLLGQLGLTPYEQKVYLHALSSGELPASTIAQTLKLPRTSVRNTLDHLCEQGLMSKLYERNTQYYRCTPPSSLETLFINKRQKMDETLSDLQRTLPLFFSLFQQKGVAPKVHYYEGVEQIIEAFNSSLFVEDLEEIHAFTSYDFQQNETLRKNDQEFYVQLRVKKGIHMYTLVGNPKMKLCSKEQDKLELRERRLLPSEYTFPGSIYVYSHYVLYFSPGQTEFMAVIIESSSFADTLRALHRFMWSVCTPQQ